MKRTYGKYGDERRGTIKRIRQGTGENSDSKNIFLLLRVTIQIRENKEGV